MFTITIDFTNRWTIHREGLPVGRTDKPNQVIGCRRNLMKHQIRTGSLVLGSEPLQRAYLF